MPVVVSDSSRVYDALRRTRKRWLEQERAFETAKTYEGKIRAKAKCDAYRAAYCMFKSGLEVRNG